MADERFMRRALELAVEGWGHTAPNPMVGAVVVRDGGVVGEGAHRQFGGEHAETEALRQAGSRARGATLYVSLEPCAHSGKTPPCVDAIRAAGVARVVAAVPDPTRAAGGGAETLRRSGIEVAFGPCEAAARELNAPFFHAVGSRRPWVTLKLAVSVDAAVSDGARSPGRLTGRQALHEVHRLRAQSDAIGVGMGTVLADDPMLTVREGVTCRVPPIRVVFSKSGRLPLTSRLAQTAREVPVIVFSQANDPAYEVSLRDLGVDVVSATSPREALHVLAARGVRSLLVEGGSRLAGAIMLAGLVDRLVTIQAPLLLGEGALPAFSGLPAATLKHPRRLRILRRVALGDDLLTAYALA